MPPLVAAAIVTGIAGAGTATIAAKSASGANKRSIEASERAAAKAEAATREEDALNRADEARRDAEDKRRYEVEQANTVRRQAQEDALLKDNLARANYEDAIRYGKMVNIARLTGQPTPPPLPKRTAIEDLAGLNAAPTAAQTTDPIMSRPSTANAAIAAPGAGVSPWEGGPAIMAQPGVPQRMPMSRLARRGRF